MDDQACAVEGRPLHDPHRMEDAWGRRSCGVQRRPGLQKGKGTDYKGKREQRVVGLLLQDGRGWATLVCVCQTRSGLRDCWRRCLRGYTKHSGQRAMATVAGIRGSGERRRGDADRDTCTPTPH